MQVVSLLRAARPNMVVPLTPKDKSLVKLMLRKFGTTGAKSGGGGGDTVPIMPSRFMWEKYKDQVHFYTMLGVIPLGLLTFYANVFIGPSTLAEIPEGYEPEPYEYHKHPISRWLVKHVYTVTHQEMYERNLHYYNESDEQRRMRLMAKKVERLMKERGDYPNYYTDKALMSKYVRENRLVRDKMETYAGEDD